MPPKRRFLAPLIDQKGSIIGMDTQTKIGQRLCTGFSGYDIPAEFERYIRESKIGNVILFAHNVQNARQLKQLCADLQALIREVTGFPPLIAVDQEGGVVSCLSDDFTLTPSAMALAAAGDPKLAHQAGLITGLELSALGVNLNLAPVADINKNPDNPVIGVRSFGEDPEKVAEYSVALMRGLMEGGVLCCAKHFPGHGDTSVDSHIGLPGIDRTLEQLEACELVPFQRLVDEGIPGVMSAHILFPLLGGSHVPATMSREIMTGLLKERMGFHGLVLSDCMMMGAVADHYGTINGAAAAVRAGVDIVLISHDARLAGLAAQHLRAELEAGGLDREEFDRSVNKILDYKKKLKAPGRDAHSSVGCTKHREQAANMYARSVTAARLPFQTLPHPGKNPLFVGCMPYYTTAACKPESAALSFSRFMQKRFGGDMLELSDNPDADEIALAAGEAPGHSCLIIGTYNAHIRPGQMDLVWALSEKGIPCVCVALRNPYDLRGLPPQVSALAAYSYHDFTFQAVARVLAGEMEAQGQLPVTLE